MTFLENSEHALRPLNINVSGMTPVGLFLGQGSLGLEVAVFSSASKPADGALQKAFNDRKKGRAPPVLVVVTHPEGASLCGTGGDQPPVFHAQDTSQAERLCNSALALPDRNAAIRFLANAMPSLETQLLGISNEGLLSLHELTHGTRNRPDWRDAVTRAKSALGKSKKELLSALGFTCQPLDSITELLSDGEKRTALAVLLKEDEVPEISSGRFNNLSPISYALTKADKERLPWVVMVQGDSVRLYNTKNIGVGRRGRTETYVECQPSLLSSNDIGLLWLLFSSEALKEGGTINSILEESKRFAADIADQLRKRIYEIVVPQLAMGIAKARSLNSPSKDDLALTYEMALTVLFRLLFIAYAEDRDLLPYKGNEAYRRRSLKQKAIELEKAASEYTPISAGDHHWAETAQLWQAISRGNKGWGVPAYDGTMFSSDAAVSKAGAMLASISLPNTSFEEALRGLLLTEAEDTRYAPVDFRSLSVREFGTIYEGLLESELSLAEQNLTMDKKGTYLPAGEADPVFVHVGEIYLHDKSGARKSSGSYYTPDFAVEHLLDGALEPALDEHLERMTGLSDADRTEQFFGFRVADIAMGSGHFLVAAIDRIERRFALWLEDNPTPGITRELQYLREAAKTELGDLADTVVIEDGQLLRRMIARRCIYGVDLNAITVQLARLSIWIHTFVPGLPLSLLDHNLVHGNALVGVGSLDEIRKKRDEWAGRLSLVDADNLLGQAAEPLQKLAQLSDASVKDIQAGRALMEEARLKTLETKALCDLITAQPVSDDPHLKGYPFEYWERQKGEVQSSAELRLAREILEPLTALHFPIAFPEVFLGRSQGFNVILGNPPWEEAVVNQDKFWARHKPGLAGLPPREQKALVEELRASRPDLLAELEAELATAKRIREFLHAGNFPGMKTGDPDLYKAFAWRFWFVSSQEFGRIGVVIPRSALSAKGSEDFRKRLFASVGAVDVVTLQNTGRWVFDMEPRYTIGLLSISKSSNDHQGIALKGPFTSLASFLRGKGKAVQRFSSEEVLAWNESVSLPLLPTPYSAEVFGQLRKSPWLGLNETGQWRARPDGELHATAQRPLMDFSETCPEGFWKVYKGASFDLWHPDTGEYNAWADPEVILAWLQDKRLRANKGARDSVHREFSEEYVKDKQTLAPLKPRIAFRDISRATDSRTVRCALLPPKTFITNKGPVLMFPRGDECDEAYLLGVLSSIPLDWYARRYVETNVNFFVFNPFPIPRPERSEPLWQRVVELSGRLACPDKRFADWAAAVGVDYGLLDPDDKQDKIHELDAVVAHLYGLSEPQLVHIFETFHEGWHYQARLNKVLKHYHAWADKA
ncbi:MAG: Eco57I restriction-modification methylase domain-containing protein [Gammaproteobacteria bacterium]